MRGTVSLSKKNIAQTLTYIDQQWVELSQHISEDQGTLIGLPHPYVIPSNIPQNGFVYRELYYWDSYFIIQGLLAAERVEQAKYQLENLLRLIERFDMVPNANRYYMLSRSQPPLLTKMIRAVYGHTHDDEWLVNAMTAAKQEYVSVWTATEHPHHRLVHAGLSRYYDINVLHELAEAESGWDYTPRFENRCLDYLPVDLNAYLYGYEQDFHWLATRDHDQPEQAYWEERMHQRQRAMRTHLWDEDRGLYVDYDFVNQHQSPISSLASLAPLFTGLSSEAEAARTIEALTRFETKHGLATTALKDELFMQKQWSNPNGWAPLHYLAVRGLRRYGRDDVAERIARKWVKLVSHHFMKTGVLHERYNVVDGSIKTLHGVYPAQIGFAWTNAVFIALVKEFSLA